MAQGEHLQHNRIAMRSEADWRRWFESYEAYVLPYARDAQAAGADMFCVGREMDSTVVRREADWRALVARIRAEFHGPLTYSANFDTWQGIGFWDALDFIGVSAYFPLSDRPSPSLAELEAGWDRALAPLEQASRRFGRPVLLTEAGFPSIPTAAKAPWREERVAGRRVAPGPLLRGDAARARPPAVDRGRVLLALGAHLAAGLPRPLARDRRQAGQLHDGELVRPGSS